MDGYRQAFGAAPEDIQRRQIAIHKLVEAARSITDAEIDRIAGSDPDLALKIARVRHFVEQI